MWRASARVDLLQTYRSVTRASKKQMHELQHAQFADMYGLAVQPEYGVCCLAMHFRPPETVNDPDTKRILSMMQRLQVDGVLSVAWGAQSYPGFCHGDFKAQIPHEVTLACHKSARVVCLDYFYLPAHYYAENYGTNWVSDKIPALLQGRVECVILPYDRLGESRTLNPNGSLVEQIENASEDSELSYFDLSWEEATELHPLVKASEHVDLIASGTNKPLNQSACDSYLKQERAFAVFHKNKEGQVRQTLSGMVKENLE